MTAEWYYTFNGEMPGRTYYNTLSDVEQARLDVMVVYYCDQPPGANRLAKTHYRIEDEKNKIYAFKPGAERFFNFTVQGGRIIITNAFHKHSQKLTKQDKEVLAVAAKYRADYLARVLNGSYYAE